MHAPTFEVVPKRNKRKEATTAPNPTIGFNDTLPKHAWKKRGPNVEVSSISHATMMVVSSMLHR
jgi:hypothetical protein